MSNSQAGQDIFVVNIMKAKTDGFFCEIGSSHYILMNNSYLLENKYNWKGLMVEYDPKFLQEYQKFRTNSIHVIEDATKVDYASFFRYNNFPKNIDYLQVDLEVTHNSTLTTLKKLDAEVFDTYKFAVITFEHDIWEGDYNDTRNESRKILKNRGYICVFHDINNGDGYPFEDWYVHPDLIDIDYVNKLMENNKINYKPDKITGTSIYHGNITYT
jgi:hypothetical protein